MDRNLDGSLFRWTVQLSLYLCSLVWTASPAGTLDHKLTTNPVTPIAHAAAPSVARTATADDATTSTVPDEAKNPVVLTFDQIPGPDWFHNNCSGTATTRFGRGFMVLQSPDDDCNEFILFAPNGIWNQYVSNQRGWIVEASIGVDPSTPFACNDEGSVEFWIHDKTNLVKFGLTNGAVCITYPDTVIVPTATTSALHVYRVEGKGQRIRVYKDSTLMIDHVLVNQGGGTEALAFGDGDGSFGTPSLTGWDYFSYQVFPHFNDIDWPQ